MMRRLVMAIVTAMRKQGELEIQSASVAETRNLEAREILTASSAEMQKLATFDSGMVMSAVRV